MRRRLDFLIPDRETASIIEDELLLAKIEDRHMHFHARDSDTLGDLPEATLSQRSDFVFGMERGVVVGVVVGAILGLGVYLFTDLGAAIGGAIVLVLALAIGAFGMWVSGMIGSSVPNPHLDRFREELDAGQILLMVDVPRDRVDEITELVQRHHPEVGYYGVEPTTPAFP